MEEVYSQQFSVDINGRLRDLEEKVRLLKDRILLVSRGLIEDREEISDSIREMKKTVISLQKENERMKEIINNITEQLAHSARKEELEIVQRQLDLLRK